MYGCAVAHKYETTSIHYTKLKNTLNFHHICFFFLFLYIYKHLLLPCSIQHIFVRTNKKYMMKKINTKIKVFYLIVNWLFFVLLFFILIRGFHVNIYVEKGCKKRHKRFNRKNIYINYKWINMLRALCMLYLFGIILNTKAVIFNLGTDRERTRMRKREKKGIF